MEQLIKNKHAWVPTLRSAVLSLMIGVIVVLLVLLNDAFIARVYPVVEPPVVAFTKVEVLNGQIRAGDVAVFKVWRVKQRDDCGPVSSDRTALNDAGDLINLPSYKGPGGSTASSFVVVYIKTPHYMPSGEYDVDTNMTYHCPDRKEPFHYKLPPAQIEIIK